MASDHGALTPPAVSSAATTAAVPRTPAGHWLRARLTIAVAVLAGLVAVFVAVRWPTTGYDSTLRSPAALLGIGGALCSGFALRWPRWVGVILLGVGTLGMGALGWLYLAAGPLFIAAGVLSESARLPDGGRLFVGRVAAEIIGVPIATYLVFLGAILTFFPQLPHLEIPLQAGEERVVQGKRYDVAVASVVGPVGELWAVKQPTASEPLSLKFRRQFEDPIAATTPQGAHTIFVDVDIAPIEERPADVQAFLTDLIRRSDETYASGRFAVVSSSSRPDQFSGAECRRYDRVATDTGVPGFPGFTFSFVFHGLACLHPSQPAIVWVDHSERFLPGVGESAAAAAEVAPVFASLQFTDRPLPTPAARVISSPPPVRVIRTVYTSALTPNDGPPAGDSGSISRQYRDDGFEIQLKTAGSYRARAGLNGVREMRVEAEVTFHRASSGTFRLMPNAGVICRATPDGDARAEYYFAIYVDGGYSISRVAGAHAENWRVVAASGGKTSPVINPTATNQIQADCVGGGPVTLVLTVNGEVLLVAVDNASDAITASGGGTGIEIDTGNEAGFGASFRSLVVREVAAN
jgi:hypothetical protein